MKVLITGGTGYIGSHVCVSLLENNVYNDIVIIDDLSNSNIKVLDRIEIITGKRPIFVKADIKNEENIKEVFKMYNDIDLVIHLAASKAPFESIKTPLKYYENNLIGTLNLLKVMNEYNVKKLIFSSTAGVYGDAEKLPLTEEAKISPPHPYAMSKYMNEETMIDLCKSDSEWQIVTFRYFNPIGAHKSGLIGEDPKDIPINIFPYINQVSIGKLDKFSVYGDDYNTPDGTCIRDYIHVMDLAEAHINAIQYMKNKEDLGMSIYNLGTSKGCSVLELLNKFKITNNVDINFEMVSRREGDIAVSYATALKAEKQLNWKAKRDIEDMCKDGWNWQLKNPDGYETKVF